MRTETSEDAAGPESVTCLLGRDHERLGVLLAEAKRLARIGDAKGAAACFAAFRGGLERHIAAEEEVLFPAFEALTGIREGGPTHVMRREHVEIRRLLEDVASRFAPGAGRSPTTSLAELTALLLAHDGKEERILYPATDRAAREAGRLEALVRVLREACEPGTAQPGAPLAPPPQAARV